MALTGITLQRGVEVLLHLKFLLAELLCYVRGTQFYWWRITNAAEGDTHPLSILVFGREMIADDVVAAFFSNREFTKIRLEPCTPLKVAKMMDSRREPGDAIVIMETPWWRRSGDQGDAMLQTLVNTRLEIKGRTYDDILEEEIGKSTRKKLHRATQKNLCIRETRDLNEILSFRKDLLAPSAKRVHGEQTNVPSEEELRKLSNKLILYLIEEDGKPIAGELNIHSKHTGNMRMWRLGINEQLMETSRLKSQYHMGFYAHHLKLACEMGLSSVSLGLTMPVMNHGNLVYKLRLACRPALNPHYPTCTIRFFTDKLPELLEKHPLLVIERDNLVGMMGIRQDLSPDAVEGYLDSFFNAYTCKGLEKVDCFAHTKWYDDGGRHMLQAVTLKFYELVRVKRQKEYTKLTFARRQVI